MTILSIYSFYHDSTICDVLCKITNYLFFLLFLFLSFRSLISVSVVTIWSFSLFIIFLNFCVNLNLSKDSFKKKNNSAFHPSFFYQFHFPLVYSDCYYSLKLLVLLVSCAQFWLLKYWEFPMWWQVKVFPVNGVLEPPFSSL